MTSMLTALQKELQSQGIEHPDDENETNQIWSEFYSKNSRNFINYLFNGSAFIRMTCGCQAFKEIKEHFNYINISVPDECKKGEEVKMDTILNREFGCSITYAHCKKCVRKNTEYVTQKFVCRLPKILMLRVEKAEKIIIDLSQFEKLNLKEFAPDVIEKHTSSHFFLI